MKTAIAIGAVLICLMVIGGASAVAMKPVECLLIVEKAKRFWQDFRTAQYVDEIIKEKARERMQTPTL